MALYLVHSSKEIFTASPLSDDLAFVYSGVKRDVIRFHDTFSEMLTETDNAGEAVSRYIRVAIRNLEGGKGV